MEIARPLTEEELNILSAFTKAAELRIKDHGTTENWNLLQVADEAGVNLFAFPKEGVLIQAIWISFLSTMKTNYSMENMKYPTTSEFLEAYPQFSVYGSSEVNTLWEIANWMNILFTFIPAKKNKGLALAIIPKLVEGWQAKYVTGSGQTRATADRVKIFETEGNTLPAHRGKQRPKKHPSNVRQKSAKPRPAKGSVKRSDHRLMHHSRPQLLLPSTRPERTRKAPPSSNIYQYEALPASLQGHAMDPSSEMCATDGEDSSSSEVHASPDGRRNHDSFHLMDLDDDYDAPLFEPFKLPQALTAKPSSQQLKLNPPSNSSSDYFFGETDPDFCEVLQLLRNASNNTIGTPVSCPSSDLLFLQDLRTSPRHKRGLPSCGSFGGDDAGGGALCALSPVQGGVSRNQ